MFSTFIVLRFILFLNLSSIHLTEHLLEKHKVGVLGSNSMSCLNLLVIKVFALNKILIMLTFLKDILM